jgi:hypothetical protein
MKPLTALFCSAVMLTDYYRREAVTFEGQPAEI